MKDLRSYVAPGPDDTGWKTRHFAAIERANGRSGAHPLPSDHNSVSFERAMVAAIDAWVLYASTHQQRYESPIGEDYFIGPAWRDWGKALRVLLNGECGRLDCGTLDSIINDNLTEQGFVEDDR